MIGPREMPLWESAEQFAYICRSFAVTSRAGTEKCFVLVAVKIWWSAANGSWCQFLWRSEDHWEREAAGTGHSKRPIGVCCIQLIRCKTNITEVRLNASQWAAAGHCLLGHFVKQKNDNNIIQTVLVFILNCKYIVMCRGCWVMFVWFTHSHGCDTTSDTWEIVPIQPFLFDTFVVLLTVLGRLKLITPHKPLFPCFSDMYFSNLLLC